MALLPAPSDAALVDAVEAALLPARLLPSASEAGGRLGFAPLGLCSWAGRGRRPGPVAASSNVKI